MNDFVSVHNLLNEVASFLIVHRPDFLNAPIICLFESLKALLELDKLVSEKLVFLGVKRVLILSFSLLNPKGLNLVAEYLAILVKFGFETLLLLVEHCLSLVKHIIVKT